MRGARLSCDSATPSDSTKTIRTRPWLLQAFARPCATQSGLRNLKIAHQFVPL